MDESVEKNEYALLQFKREEDDTQKFQKVTFYKMNPDGSFENGTTLEEMLRVSIERLTDLHERFPCLENKDALRHMNKALSFLNERTHDRKERGVEGKHEA